jgi:phage terminase large subunit-like protein
LIDSRGYQPIRQAIEALSDEEALAVLHDWSLWARPEQLPPPGDWYTWLMRGGRGGGKTRPLSEFIISRAKNGYRRIALIGQTKGDVRDTMIEVGDSSILECSPPWFMPHYEPSKRRLTWPNGCIAIAYSGDEPDQLRGPQHDTAAVDELAKFRYPQETWDNMELGLRLGPDPRVAVATTPRPIPIIKKLLKDPQTVDVRFSTYANRANLSDVFLSRILSKYEGTRLGRQELHGEILDDNPDALWSRSLIEELRVTETPDLIRVVVGVDPQAANNEDSAETGIVVAAVARSKGKLHGYILDDATIKGSPAEWGSAAVAAYHKFRADRIVGEVNNGGDMVGHTIGTVNPNISFRSVHATRGKLLRAEPVSALYEQGRVHHVGYFAELEDQLCEWVPGDKSPDRLDALVWAITELMIEEEVRMQTVVFDSIRAAGLNVDLV